MRDARSAHAPLALANVSVENGYGAEYVVVDALRSDLELDLPVVYSDDRFTVYRL